AHTGAGACGRRAVPCAPASDRFRPSPDPADTRKCPTKLQRRHRVQVTVTPLRGEAPARSVTTGESRQALRGVAEMVRGAGESDSTCRWSRWSRFTKIIPYRMAHRTGFGAPLGRRRHRYARTSPSSSRVTTTGSPNTVTINVSPL